MNEVNLPQHSAFTLRWGIDPPNLIHLAYLGMTAPVGLPQDPLHFSHDDQMTLWRSMMGSYVLPR